MPIFRGRKNVSFRGIRVSAVFTVCLSLCLYRLYRLRAFHYLLGPQIRDSNSSECTKKRENKGRFSVTSQLILYILDANIIDISPTFNYILTGTFDWRFPPCFHGTKKVKWLKLITSCFVTLVRPDSSNDQFSGVTLTASFRVSSLHLCQYHPVIWVDHGAGVYPAWGDLLPASRFYFRFFVRQHVAALVFLLMSLAAWAVFSTNVKYWSFSCRIVACCPAFSCKRRLLGFFFDDFWTILSTTKSQPSFKAENKKSMEKHPWLQKPRLLTQDIEMRGHQGAKILEFFTASMRSPWGRPVKCSMIRNSSNCIYTD